MKTLLVLTASVSLGCASLQSNGAPISIPVSVSSHNKGIVDVYLLCGDRDPQWLGVIHGKEGGLFEVPSSRARCLRGLNFFLVHRNQNRGYWVGPVRIRSGSSVHLTIEKYAGLSSARVTDDLR